MNLRVLMLLWLKYIWKHREKCVPLPYFRTPRATLMARASMAPLEDEPTPPRTKRLSTSDIHRRSSVLTDNNT